MDLVSIVVPAYNAGRFIFDTIESVQRQTYRDWEIVVVDDCSRDETAEIVQDIAKRDQRVRLIRHETNVGPAEARNTALNTAKGRYIAFLDSDDLWLPEKLERQLDFMNVLGTAFSFTQYRRISEMGKVRGRLISIPTHLDYVGLLKNTAIVTSTVVIDRITTGRFQMTKTYYDDFALWLELTKKGFVAQGLQEDLVRYRVVGKSISRNKLRSALWVWHTYRRIEGLTLPRASWYLVHYVCNAAKKHAQF